MTKNIILATTLALALTSMSAYSQTKPKAPAKPTSTNKPSTIMLKTKADRLSYAIGLNIAQGLKSQGLGDSINVQALAQALNDLMKNQKLLIKVEESQEIIQSYFMEQQSKVGDKNLAEGKKFLDENKKKPGVKVTASGLQYEVIKEGSGNSPKETDEVTVHYHGTLISGEVFDSSVERGQPATFPVNGVIKGWVEALQLMKAGAKYKLFIPAELAYGPNGAGPKIGPNTALIFEVELLSIKGQ